MTVKVSRLWGLACLIAALALVAGCGSDDDSSSGTSSGGGASTTAAGGEGPAYLADAQAALEQLYEGTDGQPPAEGPAAQRGKTVWEISCAESAEGCAVFSRQLKEAADALGWRLKIFDGNFNANNAYATGVRQAVAAGADGIILNGVDCNDIKQPVKEAKAAGVRTVAAQGAFDCTGESLYDQVVIPNEEHPTPQEMYRSWGAHKANMVIAEIGGKGKVLDFTLAGVPHVEPVSEGFLGAMEACTDCEVETIGITLSDLSSNGFVQKVSDALVRNPDAKAIVVPYDNLVTGGIAPALRNAGSPDVFVVGGEGLESNMALIRNRAGQSADVAYDVGWTAWGAADTLNRLFAGEDSAVPQGFGFTAVDLENNMPESGAFSSKVDFRSGYEKVWNGS